MTSRPALPRIAATLAISTVLLAGCGGGGSTLSASDYRAKAAAICKDATKRTGALPSPKSLSSLRSYVEGTLAIAQQDTDKIKALSPPGDLRADHDAALKAQQSAIDQLRGVKDELTKAKPDTATLQKGLDQIKAAAAKANARFAALKIPGCAK